MRTVPDCCLDCVNDECFDSKSPVRKLEYQIEYDRYGHAACEAKMPAAYSPEDDDDEDQMPR